MLKRAQTSWLCFTQRNSQPEGIWHLPLCPCPAAAGRDLKLVGSRRSGWPAALPSRSLQQHKNTWFYFNVDLFGKELLTLLLLQLLTFVQSFVVPRLQHLPEDEGHAGAGAVWTRVDSFEQLDGQLHIASAEK